MNYTKEQMEDITKREKECLDFLKEHQMTPSCQIQKVNVGQDTFADKLIPFLMDLKYKDIVSPIQKNEFDKKN
jgi:hypothetical protein